MTPIGARRPSRLFVPLLAIAALPSVAAADVVSSGIVNINIPSTEDGLTINLVTGTSSTTGSVPGWDFAFTTSYTLNCFANFSTPQAGFVRGFGGASGVNNLPLGTPVGPGQGLIVFNSTPTYGAVSANWVLSSGDNYAGVRFLDENTGQYHYGWIRFCVAENFGGQPRSIVEYAYEDTPNTAITIGAGGSGQPADCGGASCFSLPACGQNLPISSSIDCVQFAATTSCNSLLLTSDRDWQEPGSLPWRHTSWMGPAGGQVSASLHGLDPKSGQPASRQITVETLTLHDVDMDPNGSKFRFRGDDNRLSLHNSRLVCDNGFGVVWNALSPLALGAMSGSNKLFSLDGLIGPPTSLSVSSGASLTFDYCGDTAFGLPNSARCYFDNPANHADVDGGTLALHYSYVLFRNHEGDFVVRNGGLLNLSGADTTLEADTLRLENSTARLGLGGTSIMADLLTLENSTVEFSPSSEILTDVTKVIGGSTLDIDGTAGTSTGLFGSLVIEGQDSTLTIAGDGRATLELLFMSSAFSPNPKVILTEFADLEITGLNNWTQGSVEIVGENSFLIVAEGGLVISSIPIECQTGITINGQFFARGTISGSGVVEAGFGSGRLGVAGNSGATLTIEPSVVLEPFSSLAIEIDPLMNRSQRLIAESEVLMGTIGAYLQCYVSPKQDVVLPVGTKFGILDYPSLSVFQGNFWKADDSGALLAGDLITIGLNTYRLAYYDAAFDPDNPTMVTLTVVPATNCPADLNHDGMVDGADLSLLLQSWGPCPSGACPADLNGSGYVNGSDLSILLNAWGNCPA